MIELCLSKTQGLMYAIGIPASFIAGFICREMLKGKDAYVATGEGDSR